MDSHSDAEMDRVPHGDASPAPADNIGAFQPLAESPDDVADPGRDLSGLSDAFSGAKQESASNPAFILQRAPAALRWNETWIKNAAAISGTLVGLGMSVVIYSLCDQASFLGRLFNLGSIQGVLPTAMLCMFSWGAILCFLRWMRITGAERVSNMPTLLDVRGVLVSKSLPEVLSSLDRSEVTPFSPLLRRVRAVVQQWIIRPSLQDASVHLEHHLVSDDEVIRHGYGIIRTFVWSLPVMGLIGTVIGIALAVGDFGRFIGTNVEDIVAIKLALVHVTGGLSYAFTTTLLGLLGALLLVLPASALQTREERLSTRMQQGISDILLPALQQAAPESMTRIEAEQMDGLRVILGNISEGVLQKVGDVGMHFMGQAERRYIEWADRLRAEILAGAERLGKAADKLGQGLNASSGEFLSRLGMIEKSLNQKDDELRRAVEVLADASFGIQAAASAASESQQNSIKVIGEGLCGLAEATEEVLQAQQSLQTSIERIMQSQLDKGMFAVANAIEKVSAQTESALEATQSLARATNTALDSQRTLQDAMEQLDRMGLPQTLDEVARSLRQVSEILAHFQEPIVFQAVRVSSVMNAPSTSPKTNHAQPQCDD